MSELGISIRNTGLIYEVCLFSLANQNYFD
jgi:hypothetical protein